MLLQPSFNSTAAKWLVNYLIQTYFLNLKSTLTLYDSGNFNQLQLAYLEAIREVQAYNQIAVQTIDAKSMDQTTLNKKMLSQVDLGTEGFISILPDPTKFISARTYATQKSIQRIKDKCHLYLQDSVNVNDFFLSNDLNLFPWHVVIRHKNNTFEFWTQKFVGMNDNQKLLLIEKFLGNEMIFENNITDFYADKMKNMMGRTVKLGSHNYKPYVMFSNVEPGKGNVDSLGSTLLKKDLMLFGSEGNICLEFCLIWNCTIKAKNYGQDAWGELYENGTSTGIVGGVWRKEVDFGIGSIYNWYNYEFEVANGIAKSGVRIMGPGPNRLPQYLTPILPLSLLSWVVLLISMVICSIVLIMLRHFQNCLKASGFPSSSIESMILSFLDVFAMFVQQSYSKVNTNCLGARLLIGGALLSALTMENIYSGQLKSLLTVPLFEDPIDTTEKFAKMDWKWGAPAVAWEDTIDESEIPKEKILARNFEVHSVDYLRKLSYTGVWGFAVEKLHSGGFTFNDYITINDKINLILINDDVFFEFTRFIAIRGWPLKERLNALVLWVFESGLYIYWEKRYTEKYIDADVLHYIVQSERKFVPKPEPEILKISHISGPLFALLFGYILTIVIFICELLYEKTNLKLTTKF